MFAVSNGGSSFGTGGGLAGSPSDCGRGLVGGGGTLSADGGFPGSCTFGGGVGVASGGDFTGSDCARTVTAESAPRRDRQVSFSIRRRKSKSFRLSNGKVSDELQLLQPVTFRLQSRNQIIRPAQMTRPDDNHGRFSRSHLPLDSR